MYPYIQFILYHLVLVGCKYGSMETFKFKHCILCVFDDYNKLRLWIWMYILQWTCIIHYAHELETMFVICSWKVYYLTIKCSKWSLVLRCWYSTSQTGMRERLFKRRDEGYVSGTQRSRQLRRGRGCKERASSLPKLLDK